jgi:hypothetical protein
MIPAMIAMRARPPTTPPAMAGAFEFVLLGANVMKGSSAPVVVGVVPLVAVGNREVSKMDRGTKGRSVVVVKSCPT